ncbi:MAG: aspartate-semialdehyde dehydrogenase [Clostridia bacterium]|nr:aspartate-semialdehyde dehydrogenase [Clostridia bacterium]
MAAVFALAKQFDLEDAYKINLAIVGATGMVGKTFLNVLAESKIKHQIENLYLFASAESAGKTIKFENQEFEVLELNEQNILSHKIDYAFFSAGEDVSKKFAPIFAQNQAVVIDNSSAFRMEKDIPLIVPEVNFENTKSRIIANPNCSTIQVMLPLYALKKHFGLARVDFATYQAVSGSGEAGVQDLHVTAKGENPNFYPHPIFNNCLPHIGSFGDNGFSSEEMKMINETHKILNDESIEISATCVRVPVENCHCVAVSVTLHVEADLHEVHNVLRAQEGLEILDLPKDNVYPINQIANGKDAVFVGRIRKDLYNPNMVHFWCVADNLRKGAAANGVQILKKLLQNK